MYCNSYLQIVHFKRFHFLNGRWIKSHKIVDFPLKDFDPTHYLAAVPCNTIQRYKELAEMGKMSSVRVTKARSIWTKCNGTIDEFKESELQEGHENCTNFTDQIITELKKEDVKNSIVGYQKHFIQNMKSQFRYHFLRKLYNFQVFSWLLDRKY